MILQFVCLFTIFRNVFMLKYIMFYYEKQLIWHHYSSSLSRLVRDQFFLPFCTAPSKNAFSSELCEAMRAKHVSRVPSFYNLLCHRSDQTIKICSLFQFKNYLITTVGARGLPRSYGQLAKLVCRKVHTIFMKSTPMRFSL